MNINFHPDEKDSSQSGERRMSFDRNFLPRKLKRSWQMVVSCVFSAFPGAIPNYF